MGQFLSMTSYFTVLSIGSLISIKNQFGHTMQASKVLLETMYSADHYEREIPMNMTGLAELLQSVGDTVFTVQFRRQVNEQDAFEQLQNASAAAFKDSKQISVLAKQLITGSDCKLTCHMVEVENNLGRSLVRDLKTDSANKFRQIDHRTIESIIFKNVKYVLKKSGGKNFGDIDTHVPKEEAKWDSSKLAIGNVFSGTSYYETVSDMGNNEVFVYEKNQDNRGVVIDKSILCDEMFNASVWDNEEKVTKTQLASLLVDANDVCFQVCFDTQASEKKALATLSELKKAPKSESELKQLVQSCLTGNE